MISNKIDRFLFTILVVFVYKFMTNIPIPGLNQSVIDGSFGSNGALSIFNRISGGAIEKMSITVLSLFPSIIASMFVKVLKHTSDEWKECDRDSLKRRQMNRMSRWLTLVIAIMHSALFCISLESTPNLVIEPGIKFRFLAVMSIATSSIFSMWLGERITERGIGNGSSIIIFTGIVSSSASSLKNYIVQNGLVDQLPDLLRIAGVSLSFLFAFTSLFAITVFVRRFLTRLILLPIVLGVWAGIYHTITNNFLYSNMSIYTDLLKLSAISIFFMIVILFCESVIYRNEIFFRRSIKMRSPSFDVLPFKLNPAGIAPAMFSDSSIVLVMIAYNALSLLGIFKYIQIQLPSGPIFMEGLRLVWKSLFIIFCSKVWVSIEMEPAQLNEHMQRFKACFPGVREGSDSERYVQSEIDSLYLLGVSYLLLVVVIPDLINVLLFKSTSFIGISGTAIIIIVSTAIDIYDRLFSGPSLQKVNSFV